MKRVLFGSQNPEARSQKLETGRFLLLASGFWLLVALAGCRGEPVPRDYQNNPPGMTNPADNPREVPAPESSTVVPESATGAEGTAGPYQPTKPPASGKELRRVPPDTAPP